MKFEIYWTIRKSDPTIFIPLHPVVMLHFHRANRAGRLIWVRDFCIHIGIIFFALDFHFGKVWRPR